MAKMIMFIALERQTPVPEFIPTFRAFVPLKRTPVLTALFYTLGHHRLLLYHREF